MSTTDKWSIASVLERQKTRKYLRNQYMKKMQNPASYTKNAGYTVSVYLKFFENFIMIS